MNVCLADGVEVVESRSGKLVHVAELPKGVDPDHAIVPTDGAAYWQRDEDRNDLRLAASDMLVHHATLHPSTPCEFADRLAAAVRG